MITKFLIIFIVVALITGIVYYALLITNVVGWICNLFKKAKAKYEKPISDVDNQVDSENNNN